MPVSDRTGHKLTIIKYPYYTQARCSCGRWEMVSAVKTTRRKLERHHKIHFMEERHASVKNL